MGPCTLSGLEFGVREEIIINDEENNSLATRIKLNKREWVLMWHSHRVSALWVGVARKNNVCAQTSIYSW